MFEGGSSSGDRPYLRLVPSLGCVAPAAYNYPDFANEPVNPIDSPFEPVLKAVFPPRERLLNLEDPVTPEAIATAFPHLSSENVGVVASYLNDADPKNRHYRLIICRLIDYLATNTDFALRGEISARIGCLISKLLNADELSAHLEAVHKRIRKILLPAGTVNRALGRGDFDYQVEGMTDELLNSVTLSLREVR
jgi:hypothetical protein